MVTIQHTAAKSSLTSATVARPRRTPFAVDCSDGTPLVAQTFSRSEMRSVMPLSLQYMNYKALQKVAVVLHHCVL